MSSAIYHCGRCGSLFQAELGHDEDRVCSGCQQKPGLGGLPVEGQQADDGRKSQDRLGTKPEAPEGKVRHATSRRRSSNLMAWFMALWVLFMGSALWLHRHYSGLGSGGASKADLEQGKAELLAAALPECHRSLLGFLNASSPEERLKFVSDPVATAGKMEITDGRSPYPQVDVGQVGRVGQELLPLDGGWVVRTRWQVGAEGDRFDAVFHRESDGWVLDWDHFVHFSEFPWKPFLAGDGPEEGEFRLLAREIPSDVEAERKDRKLRFELLTLEDGGTAENPGASQQFAVDRLSDEGLLLGAAFAANREGGSPFGGHLKPIEPEGLVRVRVVVRRIYFGGLREFEIAKVIACHWINSDEPGFDLGKLKEDAFGPG